MNFDQHWRAFSASARQNPLSDIDRRLAKLGYDWAILDQLDEAAKAAAKDLSRVEVPNATK